MKNFPIPRDRDKPRSIGPTKLYHKGQKPPPNPSQQRFEHQPASQKKVTLAPIRGSE